MSAEKLVDNQIWTDYYLYKPLSESATFVHRIGARFHLPESNNRYLLHYRPSIRIKRGAFESQVGSAVFYQEKQDDVRFFELRPWLGIKHKVNLVNPITFINLARLEYRLSNNPASGSTMSDDLRLRYRIGINGTMNSGSDSYKIYGLATAESFWNLADLNQFDYNLLRLNIGVGASLDRHMQIEFVYTKQLSQLGNLDLKQSYSNLFQLKFRHRL